MNSPLQKLGSTALSSKFQALALGVGTVLALDTTGVVKAIVIGAMVIGYMIARAYEDAAQVVADDD